MRKKPKKKHKMRDKSSCVKATFMLRSFHNLLWGLKGFGNIPTSKSKGVCNHLPCLQLLKQIKMLKYERLDLMMKKEYYNEENGLWYELGTDGIYYPLLSTEHGTSYEIGKYGRMRKRYLQEYHYPLFNHLLLSGKLNEHLHEVDVKAQKFIEEFVSSMAKKEGCDSKIKMQEQMKWVGLINNYKACAEEIVLREVIYK